MAKKKLVKKALTKIKQATVSIKGYATVLLSIKNQIQQTQVKATLAANKGIKYNRETRQ
ncbi:MAG: hypothetical protein ABH827_06320 [bacterium]